MGAAALRLPNSRVFQGIKIMSRKVPQPGKHHVSVKPEKRELSILQLIHSGPHFSRLELARKTGLSPASMTSIVRRLIERDIVRETSAVSALVGRKPISLEVRGNLGNLVGIDIGTFYTRIVITDINGKIAYRHEIQTGMPEGRVQVLKRVFQCVHKAITAAKLGRHEILGIGVAHSGVIDTERGLVLSFPRPGQMAEWKNVPLQAIFEEEFNMPCLLEDSVRTMATAERYFGLGQQVDDFLFVEVGMGIGASLIFGGKLYRGGGGNAGEFGHITVDENGPLCSCGNRGCLESVASCGAIIQAGRIAIERGVDSKIRDLSSGDLNQISIEAIAQAAAENDSLAFRVLQEASSYIAKGLADIVTLLNPKLIIFGGALFRAAPQLLSDPLKRVIRERSLEKSSNDVQLKVSPLGREAGALGAARMIAERTLKDLYLRTTSR